MRLVFEDNLEHQRLAIEAVADLFIGQEIGRTEFSLVPGSGLAGQTEFGETSQGFGNRLLLPDEKILQNLRKVQARNGTPRSSELAERNFTVEMETGTGKTYVYLRTIFELARRYGFTKFVIVVPSIAIKEGTHKTLEITRDHFEGLYPEAKGYEYFLYDSTRLGDVRTFVASTNVQIMLTTVGAINKKDVNNIYKPDEMTGGERPIDLVRATKPIIVVDEPQSVDGGLKGSGKKALDDMGAICTLRYSATHVNAHHMVYRLSAVDAYERGLVKQIEVASLSVQGDGNRPYVRLRETRSKKGNVCAIIEYESMGSGKYVTVEDGNSLEKNTRMKVYENHRIGTIKAGKNPSMVLETPDGAVTLRPGEETHGIEPDVRNRLMIRRTIKAHFDKENVFFARKQQIKVLSLFFIDKVRHYRDRDGNGKMAKGKFASMFEEEYAQLAAKEEYRHLFKDGRLAMDAESVHEGYFSIDGKGGWVEPELKATGELADNAANRTNAGRAYSLIMQDKETLLSFGTKLRFIFSHSALREGWDNPNIFQICALRDMGSAQERRQTIGRGLRLCVDQSGTRSRDAETNVLTVVATESYEQFAKNLQKEIEQDSGGSIGVVRQDHFADVIDNRDGGDSTAIGPEKSLEIWEWLLSEGHIDGQGNIQSKLRQTMKLGGVALEGDLAWCSDQVTEKLRRLCGQVILRNADMRVRVQVRDSVFESEGFKELWNRIKHKTVYRLKFDSDALVKRCADRIREMPPVAQIYAQFKTAHIGMGTGVVQASPVSVSARTLIDEPDLDLPDILSILEDKTHLTRRGIVKALLSCGRLDDFRRNPREFVRLCGDEIDRAKQELLADGIVYCRAGDDQYYSQELFKQSELEAYLDNTVKAHKSVFDHVVIDSSGVEHCFANDLDRNESVRVFAKLPRWFKVSTPLGSYNPDWAILIEAGGQERLYLVVETKSSNWRNTLRPLERSKIDCGERHFKAIATGNNPAVYKVASSLDETLDHS